MMAYFKEMYKPDASGLMSLDPVSESVDMEENEELVEPEIQIVVVGSQCQKNLQLKAALVKLKSPVYYSQHGEEYSNNEEDVETFFVYENFEDDIYKRLRDAECRIVGPPVIFKCAEDGKGLPFSPRPLYCMVMHKLIFCFAGFKVKEELARLADLAHHMGASIRKDFSSRATHLVAKSTGGEKYRAAVSLGTPIMTSDWVEKVWECRDQPDLDVKDERFNEFKMSPFFRCVLAFYGFSTTDQSHMEELTGMNGGSTAGITECYKCTHIVMNDASVKQLPMEVPPKVHVVKSEWFWGSIQMNACANEDMYKFSSNGTSPLNRFDRTSSVSKVRKRKRLKENLAQLAQEGEVESPFHSKRQSTDISRMSLSASLLDVSCDTSVILGDNQKEQEPPKSTIQPAAKITARMQVVKELLQTETNYVGILETILRVFKDAIEDPEQPGGPLLPPKDVDIIFNGLPEIYNLHAQVRDELLEIINNWTEEACVGEVIQKHAGAMEKAYPPFVNFFDQTKETIKQCDKTVPRFHAFLKRCLMKPECGRQTLQELIIRPVQRLPSVMLLLNDIIKHTPKTNQDHEVLEQALASLKNVMTHINEDRRKTESQVAMFDIMNDIENCPPTLLSAHRQFISRINVLQISDEPGLRGDQLCLFLFSDYLEICKRRSRAALQSYKSPSNAQKPYRHIELVTLSSIKRVIDCTETDEMRNMFAIIYRPTTASKEKLYSFMIISEEVQKEDYLVGLCKQIANTTCRTDYENLLVSMDASSLEIDATEINNQSFSTKAKRFASRTRKRVGRVFSFNNTPRKLKRAISSVGESSSPFQTPKLTPRSVLGSRLAASTMDLEALGKSGENAYSPAFLTPRPVRKIMETPNSDADSPNMTIDFTPGLTSLPVLSMRGAMSTVLKPITDSPLETDA